MLDRSTILTTVIRTGDHGPDVVVPPAPVPCTITASWDDGTTSTETGHATAWTSTTVEVRLSARGHRYRGVWLPLVKVTRTDGCA